jgi:hypothetical protein
MYNTKVVCTYHTNEVFLESDEITDEERYFVRDAIYRQEVLDILGMDDYNEAEMLRTVHDLFQKVGECDELKECGLKLAGQFMSNDSEFGLMLLFAYDFMYLTHICISEYLDTGKMSEQNILNLRAVVFRDTF